MKFGDGMPFSMRATQLGARATGCTNKMCRKTSLRIVSIDDNNCSSIEHHSDAVSKGDFEKFEKIAPWE